MHSTSNSTSTSTASVIPTSRYEVILVSSSARRRLRGRHWTS
ncbi:hypothetical protein [Nonomuraea sp. NPDC049158]